MHVREEFEPVARCLGELTADDDRALRRRTEAPYEPHCCATEEGRAHPYRQGNEDGCSSERATRKGEEKHDLERRQRD